MTSATPSRNDLPSADRWALRALLASVPAPLPAVSPALAPAAPYSLSPCPSPSPSPSPPTYVAPYPSPSPPTPPTPTPLPPTTTSWLEDALADRDALRASCVRLRADNAELAAHNAALEARLAALVARADALQRMLAHGECACGGRHVPHCRCCALRRGGNSPWPASVRAEAQKAEVQARGMRRLRLGRRGCGREVDPDASVVSETAGELGDVSCEVEMY
ncbi:unnamed protein product [Cutaneotrichosporon oleaginosum]